MDRKKLFSNYHLSCYIYKLLYYNIQYAIVQILVYKVGQILITFTDKNKVVSHFILI